jgi:hypothetical protein
MQEGNRNGEQTEKPKFDEPQRCRQLMTRIIDIAMDEFPDVSPPRIVFVLEWVKHRYLVAIEDIVRHPHTPAQQPEVNAAPPMVCKYKI